MTDRPREAGWRSPQVWLPIAYAILAASWVAGSDTALWALTSSAEEAARWSRYKGWAFVAATAFLLHLLLRAAMARRDGAMRRLEASEQRARRLVAASPDAILVEADFHVVFANEAAARLFGARDAAELDGRPVWDLIHPDDHEAVLGRTAEAASGATFEPVATRRMVRLDGTVLRCEVALAPFEAPEQPGALVVTIRDTTPSWLLQQERERINAALRVLSTGNEALVRASSEHELVEEICRVVVQFGGFRLAFVGLVEEGAERAVRLVAAHGADEGALASLRRAWAERLGDLVPAGASLAEGRPSVVADLASDPPFQPLGEELRRLDLGPAGFFPLLLGAERVGVLGIACGPSGVPDPPVVALLQQLADDLAIGLAALRTRAALADERNMLQAILDHASVPMGVLDGSGRAVRVNAPFAALSGRGVADLLGRRLEDGMVPAEELAAVQAVLARVWAGESPLVHVNHHVAHDGSRRLLEWTNTLVRGADGAPRFLVGLGHDITERERNEASLRDSREQLRALAGRLQTVREEEKARIARDLHDELGQLLTGLKMDLRWLEKRIGDQPATEASGTLLDRLVAASELADQTVASVQRIAAELRPGTLDRLGLAPALRQEARLFARRTGIACDAGAVQDAPEPPAPVAMALYRICQEAMTNVTRHAGATAVTVRLAHERGALVLCVEDDGRGFDQSATGPDALGLLGMAERATALGGTVRFERGSPRGTVVVARIPVPAGQAGGAAT